MMRISDLVEKAMLTEAVNFRSEQVRHVMSKMSDFRIGIEYEFNIDSSHLHDIRVGGGDISSDDLYTPEVERRLESWFKNLYGSEIKILFDSVKFIYMNTSWEVLADLIEAMGYNDDPQSFEQEARRILDLATNHNDETALNMMGRTSQVLDTVHTSIKRLPYEVTEAFFTQISDSDDNDNFETALYNVVEALEDIGRTPTFDTLYEVIKSLEEKTVLEEIRSATDKMNDYRNLHELITEMMVQEAFQYDVDEQREEVAREIAESEPNAEHAAQATAFIENEFGDDPRVWGVTEDVSVGEGGELITHPLTFIETLKFMKEVFPFIRQYGSTDDKTGMHVNISHKRFKDINNMDLLKLIILIDPDYVQSEPLSKWKERSGMVENLYRGLTRSVITQATRAYNADGISGLEDLLRKYLVQPAKFKSINFTNAFGHINASSKRIEFRFFGGANYEKRYDDIERDIAFSCYTILAAMDESFLRRDYLEHLIKVMNRYAHKHFQMTFIELARVESDPSLGFGMDVNRNMNLKAHQQKVAGPWIPNSRPKGV